MTYSAHIVPLNNPKSKKQRNYLLSKSSRR